MRLPKVDIGVIHSISEVLGDTEDGFTGPQIVRFLSECNIEDTSPTSSKRVRLSMALTSRQEVDDCGNTVLAFVQHVMNPVIHHKNYEWFQNTSSKLNHILSFAGYKLGENGKLVQTDKVETHIQALSRASKLREHLIIRKVHVDVLMYCREELLVDNYFHAVFEATKSVADKIRHLSGLGSDGAELVDEAFSFKSVIPCLAINSLQTDSEQSEQKGFMNLLKGLFGTFRNTTAHVPKIKWEIEEQDALDILSLISLLHRRLDSATLARQIYLGKVK